MTALPTLAVTGGTGFVGSHLLTAARAAGYQVRALTRGWRPSEPGIDWIEGTLDRPEAWSRSATAPTRSSTSPA